jgi:hypothetical protein
VGYSKLSIGHYIRYPDIIRERKLFKDDGVHLAPVANIIFLQTLQGGIEHFISGLGKVYPPGNTGDGLKTLKIIKLT